MRSLLAVKTVLSGRRFISQEMTNLLLDGMLHPGQGRRETSHWDTLSNRERTIFKLIAEGGTNRSAAAYLNLSTKTVEKHRANLMRKMQLGSAVELALLAVELGLIERPQVHKAHADAGVGRRAGLKPRASRASRGRVGRVSRLPGRCARWASGPPRRWR